MGELPWTLKREKEEIGAIKEQFLTPQTLLKDRGCPACLAPFMEHVASLEFADTPNYDLLVGLLDVSLLPRTDRTHATCRSLLARVRFAGGRASEMALVSVREY